MRRQLMPLGLRILLITVVFCAGEAVGGNLKGKYTPSPDRLTPEEKANGITQSSTCPPNRMKGGKAQSVIIAKDPRDKDMDNADGDNDEATGKDYFMGEWYYVKDGKDVKAQLWCIGGSYKLSIITSLNGVDTVRVRPVDPCCYYGAGKNTSYGIRFLDPKKPGEDQDFGDEALPGEFHWLSWDRENNNLKEVATKTFFFVRDDQTVAVGKVVKMEDNEKGQPSYKLGGNFIVEGVEYTAKDLKKKKKTKEEEAALQGIIKIVENELAELKRTYGAGKDGSEEESGSFYDPQDQGCSVDGDGDAMYNFFDNCPYVFNPDQADADGDGIGDACEPHFIESDIALSQAAPSEARAGEEFKYSMEVVNNGPSDISSMVLLDALPEDADFIRATGECLDDDGIIWCELGELKSGNRRTVDIYLRHRVAGLSTNIATIMVAGSEPDPNLANNQVSVSYDVLSAKEASKSRALIIALLTSLALVVFLLLRKGRGSPEGSRRS